MNPILLLLIVFIIAIFIIMAASIWFMNAFTRKYIGEKHMVLEELTRGEVPELWSRKYKQKRLKFEIKGKAEKVDKLNGAAHKDYLRNLNKIVTYIQKTSLVEDEETRSSILSDLEKTRHQWRENKVND
ncbi:hypothetical protein KHA96_04360 [Bacillus sp. FJAT-49711]|uniref:hypothetical protein n=1 Tax=Bacillus sp. FJAT-49711 TaxID=2833585 RepID=UPI001BC94745|nr:hypothetical protein [Bacillus sp. FJAT-49711]MBS4217545.1 hypothetical protein [Bacillus sp. FJAT-49711]